MDPTTEILGFLEATAEYFGPVTTSAFFCSSTDQKPQESNLIHQSLSRSNFENFLHELLLQRFCTYSVNSFMDNPNVQEILEKQVLTVAKVVEDKLDEEIAVLDRLDSDDLEVLRERRLQQMKKLAEKKRRWIGLGHGEYSEIPAEKEFFSVVKASERVVCHFYRENWPCKVMDKHLSILAKQHIETRFVKLNAEKSQYLAEKLRIVVLPTLALVKNAKVEDYVVGFDELGGRDDFSTEELEERLSKAQVIVYEGESSLNPTKSKVPSRSVRQSSTSYSSDSE